MRVFNRTRQTALADRAVAARSFWARLRGLMGRPNLSPGEGLVLFGDNSIHMFFMRFPIDVLYLDTDSRIIRLDESLRPWRVGPMVRGCQCIVELPAGTIQSTQTAIADQILLE